MHDLIQEMGWEIIHQENRKEPGRRSRLWDPEEVYHVLRNNKGTNAIEGIMLDVSKIKEVHLNVDTFRKMTNLRYFKFYSHDWKRTLYNVNLPSGLESFCEKLRYFQWDGYPLESLPSTVPVEKLVKLCMRHSQVTKLWDGVQELVNLREIDLSGSEQLIELPDFSKAQSLQSMNLSACESLCNVHSSILSLHSLDTLNLHSCKKLKSLKSDTHLKSLRYLIVHECSSMKEFSLSGKEIKCLCLKEVAIEILYPSIGGLSNLEYLEIHGEKLKNLPMEIFHLKYLRKLELHNYGQVIEKWKLHILFDSLHSLDHLSLHGCSKLSELPDNIKYSRLSALILSECNRLQSLPELPPSINYLEAFGCTSLETVFPLKIFRPELSYWDIEFLFLNCVKLDEDSLLGSMEFSQFLKKRPFHYNYRAAYVCYPGSIVPRWFIYKQMTGASITIDIGPTFDHLLGFVFCSVVSQFALKKYAEWYINFDCYFEDGEKVYWGTKYCFNTRELKLDHVLLWEEYRLARKDIIERVRKRRRDDEATTYNTKLSFQFSIRSSDGVEHDGLIKACGVYLIYADSKLELGTKTKRRRDIDEQQQPPPLQLKFARKMKGFLSLAN